MRLSRLSLALTDRCSAACDICALSCGPDRGRAMDEALMLRVIREAKAIGAEAVDFSGGEPFLLPDLLEEGLRAARAEGLETCVVTNGFWGAWEDDRILETLNAMKPDSLCFRYSDFHRKFISEDHLFRAIYACMPTGIKPTLLIADMRDDYSAGRLIHSLGNRRYNLDLRIYPVRRVGRAAKLPEEWFLPSGVSGLSGDTLSVHFNGDVYPCRPEEGFELSMKLGNVCEKPLRAVLGEASAILNMKPEEVRDDVS